jgi:hypothetical protein
VLVQLKLVEASPDILWTYGGVKNLSAPDATPETDAEARLGDGTQFPTGPGLHRYLFEIKGNGSVKIQAFDLDHNVALAQAESYDTKAVHGGHVYKFGVG